jgi:hypothetical protein
VAGSWWLGPGGWALVAGSWWLGPGGWALVAGSWWLGPGGWVHAQRIAASRPTMQAVQLTLTCTVHGGCRRSG